jgi:hypothetical protein
MNAVYFMFPRFIYFISFVSKRCVPCKKTLDTKNLQLLSTENVKSCTLTALSSSSFERCLVGAPYYSLSASPFEVVWMLPQPLFFFSSALCSMSICRTIHTRHQ